MRKSILSLLIALLAVMLISFGVSCHDSHSLGNMIPQEVQPEAAPTEGGSPSSSAAPEQSAPQSQSSNAPASTPAAPEPINKNPVKTIVLPLGKNAKAGNVVLKNAVLGSDTLTYSAGGTIATASVGENANSVEVPASKIQNINSVVLEYNTESGTEKDLLRSISFSAGSSSVKAISLDDYNNQPIQIRAENEGKENEAKKYGKLEIVLEDVPYGLSGKNGSITLSDVNLKLNGVEEKHLESLSASYVKATDGAASKYNVFIPFENITAGSYNSLEISFKYNGERRLYTHNSLSLSEVDFATYYVNRILVSEGATANRVYIRVGEPGSILDKGSVKVVFNDGRKYDEVSLSLQNKNGAYYNPKAEKVSDSVFYFDNVPAGSYIFAVLKASVKKDAISLNDSTNRTEITYYGEVSFMGENEGVKKVVNGATTEISIPSVAMNANKGIITFDSYFAVRYSGDVEVKVDPDSVNAMEIKSAPNGASKSYVQVNLCYTPFMSSLPVKGSDGRYYKIYHVLYHMQDVRYDNNNQMLTPWMEPGDYTISYNGQTFKVFIGSGENTIKVMGSKAKELIEQHPEIFDSIN